jgi:single-stranded-DNA-specific exonuclease
MVKWIITHGDTDGICSGAIALSALKGAKVYFSHPAGLADDLQQVDGDYIICDIAIPQHFLGEVMKQLRRIEAAGHKGTYIDHHPLPKGFDEEGFPPKLIHSLSSCVAELAYTTFENTLGRDLGRVAIYGAIGDYLDNTYDAIRLLTGWDKRELYLEAGLLIEYIDSIGRNHDLKRQLVQFLSNNHLPSSDEVLVNKAIAEAIKDEWMRKKVKELVKVEGSVAYVLDADWSLSKGAIYARAEAGAQVGMAGETRKDVVEVSLRTPSDTIDLNAILSVLAPTLGGSGGGHAKAAGARVPKEKWLQLITGLNRAIEATTSETAVEY